MEGHLFFTTLRPKKTRSFLREAPGCLDVSGLEDHDQGVDHAWSEEDQGEDEVDDKVLSDS